MQVKIRYYYYYYYFERKMGSSLQISYSCYYIKKILSFGFQTHNFSHKMSCVFATKLKANL